MMDLSGKPVLHWVLSRAKRAKQIDSIWLATSNKEKDNPLEELANKLNVPVYRGSESDVLGRFVATAKIAEADYVVRICGDNPLIAKEEIDRLVKFYKSLLKENNNKKILYAFNFASKMGNQYPDGFGAEILSFSLLNRLSALDENPSSREHVTKYIWDHPEKFSIRTLPAPKEIAHPSIKLDVDTQEDFEKLKVLFSGLDKNSTPEKIIQVYIKQFGL